MKSFLLALFTVFITFALVTPDAEARRMGGGRSSGMQRQATPPQATPQSPQKSPAAGAQATPQKRSWMGPLAGLAAGLGLAALASHFGFGEEMANILMLALLAMVVFMAVRWFMNRNRRPQAMQYAANAPMGGFEPQPQAAPVMGGGSAPVAAPAATLPADFDRDAFVRLAKITFIRMQAAHDAGNLNDLRDFLSPEMFAEVQLDIEGRHNATSQTDVLNLEAEVADWAEEGRRQIVSVRYSGQLREDGFETPFNEIWHLVREDGAERWVVAGIQQS